MKSFELVLIGHPDKVCDRVSQVICNHNKNGRNAIECCWGNKLFTVNGETDFKWTTAKLEKVVKSVLDKEIGLVKEELDSITVVNNLNVQSPEINNIVGDLGTGDNGIYFGGYHRVYSPVIRKMKDLCLALTAKKLSGWGYRSDGKFIFTVDKTGEIVKFVINVASFPGVELKTDKLIDFIKTFVGELTEISVNPKGNWHNCFAFADSGLTGRKLACDGTCGLFSHGGGAMFGKDISKADVTVPLYLGMLAEQYANKGIFKRKVVSLEASSIIGDRELTIYKNGKLFSKIPFKVMKDYVGSRELNIFGVLK